MDDVRGPDRAALLTGGLGAAYALSRIAGALLVVTSVCGLLSGGWGFYDPDPATLPAFLAQDAVALPDEARFGASCSGRGRASTSCTGTTCTS